MTLKTIVAASKPGPTYPCLKQYNKPDDACHGTVVLFVGPKAGAVVHSSGAWRLGDYAADWVRADDPVWTDVDSVTISTER